MALLCGPPPSEIKWTFSSKGRPFLQRLLVFRMHFPWLAPYFLSVGGWVNNSFWHWWLDNCVEFFNLVLPLPFSPQPHRDCLCRFVQRCLCRFYSCQSTTLSWIDTVLTNYCFFDIVVSLILLFCAVGSLRGGMWVKHYQFAGNLWQPQQAAFKASRSSLTLPFSAESTLVVSLLSFWDLTRLLHHVAFPPWKGICKSLK